MLIKMIRVGTHQQDKLLCVWAVSFACRFSASFWYHSRRFLVRLPIS
jgi:hypothetical protein